MSTFIAPLIFGFKGLTEFTKRGYLNASKKFTPIDSDLSGKVVIITGANSGLGYSSALSLAKLNATVIMVCRNPESAAKSKEAIIKESSNANVFVELCDLSRPKNVKEFAHGLKNLYPKIDVLVFLI